jgi:hypothetical protein
MVLDCGGRAISSAAAQYLSLLLDYLHSVSTTTRHLFCLLADELNDLGTMSKVSALAQCHGGAW